VKFLVDAQLPRALSLWLSREGHDSVHTLDLPNRNRTTDREILDLSRREQRTVVTKDTEFLESFILHGQPAKLLLITTGNISNRELLDLLERHCKPLFHLLQQHAVVELNREELVVHA